jgi:hypothetical protein
MWLPEAGASGGSDSLGTTSHYHYPLPKNYRYYRYRQLQAHTVECPIYQAAQHNFVPTVVVRLGQRALISHSHTSSVSTDLMASGRIFTLLISTRPGQVVYERFYDSFRSVRLGVGGSLIAATLRSFHLGYLDHWSAPFPFHILPLTASRRRARLGAALTRWRGPGRQGRTRR